MLTMESHWHLRIIDFQEAYKDRLSLDAHHLIPGAGGSASVQNMVIWTRVII